MLLAIHFARHCLLGRSPIPYWSQKFLLRLRVLRTLGLFIKRLKKQFNTFRSAGCWQPVAMG